MKKGTALKRIVEESDTVCGKAFDLVIQLLIVLSMLALSIETLPSISEESRSLLRKFEVFIVLIFTIEYLIRVLVTDRKLGFIFSFLGIIDLVAILPFYLASGIDLRSIRVFRMFRLVRIFKLARYSKAIMRLHKAFSSIKEELILFFFITVALIYLAGVGIYYFENPVQPDVFSSIFHSLWWGVTTLTTVGYGDTYPVTVGGKIFTFIILIIGLGVVSIPAGLIASALSNARDIED